MANVVHRHLGTCRAESRGAVRFLLWPLTFQLCGRRSQYARCEGSGPTDNNDRLIFSCIYISGERRLRSWLDSDNSQVALIIQHKRSTHTKWTTESGQRSKTSSSLPA